MKKIIMAVSLLFSSVVFTYGQEFPMKDGKIVFDTTIHVNRTKDQLYEGALQWIASQTFDKPERDVTFPDVISYKNKEEGKILGNGKFKFDTKYPKLGYYDYMYMTFKFRLYILEDGYRYVFSDFRVNRLTWHKRDHIGNTSFEDYSTSGYYRRHSEESINDHLQYLQQSLHSAMLGKL